MNDNNDSGIIRLVGYMVAHISCVYILTPRLAVAPIIIIIT